VEEGQYGTHNTLNKLRNLFNTNSESSRFQPKASHKKESLSVQVFIFNVAQKARMKVGVNTKAEPLNYPGDLGGFLALKLQW